MDTLGFGDSYRPTRPASIELYAEGVIDLIDALSIEKISLVGHHTGGVIAVEVAASFPERVDKLILSSTPFIDNDERERRKNRPPIDEVQLKEDGSHLVNLWQKRMLFYPKNRPDLLNRFMKDALSVFEYVEEGHRSVSQYKMEDKVKLIKAATLIVTATDDPFAYPHRDALCKAIAGCKSVEIPGGMVPMVDQMPEEFARVVIDFLSNMRTAG